MRLSIIRAAQWVCPCLIVIAVCHGVAQAHFPWLATDDKDRAILFFSESPAERDYRLPDSVLEARVMAYAAGKQPDELKLSAVEEGEFVGRRGDAVAKGVRLEAAVHYGVYHGMLLDYYVKGLTRVAPDKWQDSPKAATLKLDVTPHLVSDGKLGLAVRWEGKPLAGAAATMVDSEGKSTEARTNGDGVAMFKAPKKGLVGFLVNRMDDKAAGKHDDEEYTSAGQYATVTIQYDPSAATSTAAATPSRTEGELPPLPEGLASFGAAVCDGWLYVYGGHIGTEHDHSKENLSDHFRRISLDGGKTWEELPMQTPLQGLPLVAHVGKLYRVGGLSARNAADEEDDLHSVAEFACFDPESKTWQALPQLPEPRSSHDAVVMDGVLYVVGGWTLKGEGRGDWLSTAWSYDLTDPKGQWEEVTRPNFKRRALAVATWKGKLVALGGMDDKNKVSVRADALDLNANAWSSLPDLPGGKMRGFGVSAWSLGDELYVSGAEGMVYRLSADGSSWEEAGELATGRFFHRLVPRDSSTLLAVAGASYSDGHLASIEIFSPKAN